MRFNICVSVFIIFATSVFLYGIYSLYKVNTQENLSFCEYTEEKRLKECPLIRTSYQLDSGEELLVYICNNNSGYIETKNLSEKSSKTFLEHISSYKAAGMSVVEICNTKNGSVYKLIQGVKND